MNCFARPHRRPLVRLLVACLAVTLAARFAGAAAYEGFDYPVGPNTAPLRGGSGFVDGTTSDTPNGWRPGAIMAAGSLTDPTGTLATTGNHLTGVRSFTVERRLAETLGTPGTDVWMSWLQRRSENSPGFEGLVLLQPTGSGAFGLYFVGEPGGGPGDGTFVIERAGQDFDAVSSGVPVLANQTAFLVTHFQFREGNDSATLYVNPTPGAAPPTGGVTFSGLDMPLLNPLIEFIGATDNRPVTYDFDELRIGSTYAAVAPTVPEPTAIAAAAAALGLALRRRRPCGA